MLFFVFFTGNSFGQDNEIRIGEFASLSGQIAFFGQSCHSGIVLAVEQINSSGGIGGRKIKLFTEDDQSKAEDALASVHHLIILNHVIALLGEVASSRSRAAAPYAQLAKIPMISPASTNPEVTKIGDYIFRTCFIDPSQGEAMANFARKTLHAKRTAILLDVKQDYCITVANAFQRTFQKIGGQIVSEQAYSTDDKDFTQILLAVDSAHVDVIFLPGYYSDVSLIVRQARALGIAIPILGADGWDSPELTIGAEKEFNNTYFSNHYSPENPEKELQTFVAKYKVRYEKEPDNMAALGYDAARVLVDAIRRAKSTDPQKIRNAIAATKNFHGITGLITMGKNGDAQKPLTVLQIIDGKPHFAQCISAKGEPMTEFKPINTAVPFGK